MKLCTAVQEGCSYKNALRAHRYYASLAKYFTVCISYQPSYVNPRSLFVVVPNGPENCLPFMSLDEEVRPSCRCWNVWI